jgi:hypothetical protein
MIVRCVRTVFFRRRTDIAESQIVGFSESIDELGMFPKR